MDTLKNFRGEIDKIDIQILKTLKKRFKITQRVQIWKKKHNIPIFQKKREEIILKRLRQNCKKIGVSPKMIRQIYETLFRESRGNIKKQ